MARQLRPINFESFASMAGHLDRWAAQSLTSPEAWQAALVDSHDWLDYAPRNQVLLISYGINGPAAGAETWRLVPSSEPGRECAVRAGEHGFPVRVPITTAGREPDPFVGGTRPTRAQVERWEWRQVYTIDQLARRPGPGTLTPHVIPDNLTGETGHTEFTAAVARVATATVRGRLQRSADPQRMLADAAGRMPRSADRPELIPTLREQVAWLVAERVGHAPTAEPPSFDPTLIRPRERWERLLDVLDPARRLTASLGATIGVDLVRSSIPRMQVVDDRVVPAGRRHRLPAATLEGLPVGKWVSVGPYTADEWLARGELGWWQRRISATQQDRVRRRRRIRRHRQLAARRRRRSDRSRTARQRCFSRSSTLPVVMSSPLSMVAIRRSTMSRSSTGRSRRRRIHRWEARCNSTVTSLSSPTATPIAGRLSPA